MEVEFHQHAKAPDILCSVDREDISNVGLLEELSPARAARLLGVRSSELKDLAESGALKTQADEDGRAIVTGRDLRNFVKQLRAIRFTQVDGDEDAVDEDGYGDAYGDEADPPVGDLPLSHFITVIKRALLGTPADTTAPNAPNGTPAKGATVAVSVAPAAPTTPVAGQTPDTTASPPARRTNPRAIRMSRPRAK